MGTEFSNEVLDVRGCRVTLKRGGSPALHFGTLLSDLTRRSMERVAADVMPQLKQAAAR